jgi:hypothetical protein
MSHPFFIFVTTQYSRIGFLEQDKRKTAAEMLAVETAAEII